MEPVQPTTFHSGENPKRAAIAPAARGGLCLDHRPITISATSTGAPNTKHASTNTAMNAKPPPAPARYGKRQMLPSPTAAPTALRQNARSDDQRWPLTPVCGRESWKNRNHTRRKSRATFRLRPGDHDQRSGFGNLVQIGQHLDLIMVEAEYVTLERIIILGGGYPWIRIRGFVPRGRDLAILIQNLQNILAPAGVMRDAGGIAVLHGGIVGPALRPVGTHRDKRMLRNTAVLCLPILHVLKGEHVVRVFRNLGMHVEHHQRQQHLLWVNLIDRAQPLVKVRRRIDVGTSLTHMRELLDLEPVLLDGIEINDSLIAEPFPMRRRRSERMRKIDESLAGEACIHLFQAGTRSLCR